MNSNWMQEAMDGMLRAIPGLQGIAYARFLEERPGSQIEKTQMWLNCEGVESSPHPIWRKKHTPACKGIALAIRDLSLDPNSSEAVWSAPLIADRFCVMEGLTPAMSEELGRIHREYSMVDLSDLRSAEEVERVLGL